MAGKLYFSRWKLGIRDSKVDPQLNFFSTAQYNLQVRLGPACGEPLPTLFPVDLHAEIALPHRTIASQNRNPIVCNVTYGITYPSSAGARDNLQLP